MEFRWVLASVTNFQSTGWRIAKLQIHFQKLLTINSRLSNKKLLVLQYRSLGTSNSWLSPSQTSKVARLQQLRHTLSTHWTWFKTQSRISSWDNNPPKRKTLSTQGMWWCTTCTLAHKATATKKPISSLSTKFNTEWTKNQCFWTCSPITRATSSLVSQLISTVWDILLKCMMQAAANSVTTRWNMWST